MGKAAEGDAGIQILNILDDHIAYSSLLFFFHISLVCHIRPDAGVALNERLGGGPLLDDHKVIPSLPH